MHFCAEEDELVGEKVLVKEEASLAVIDAVILPTIEFESKLLQVLSPLIPK